MSSPPILPASTLVLARDSERGPEVWLSRRTQQAVFLANASVYPGGRVDPDDGDPAWQELFAPGGDLHFGGRLRGDYADERLRAFVVAAIRETFEEAGVLLVREADGSLPNFLAEGARERLQTLRQRLNQGGRPFLELIRDQNWRLDIAALEVFSRWITPPLETRRFDTLFFFAPLPPGQDATPDHEELVEGAWWRPREIIRAHERGELLLAPPTLCTVYGLTAGQSLAEIRQWAASQPVVPIESRFVESQGHQLLVLPGDPLYPSDRPAPEPRRFDVPRFRPLPAGELPDEPA